MEWPLLVLILGVNLTLWTLIGGMRLTAEKTAGKPSRHMGRRLTPDDVAVLIPAHNEEPVIGATLDSVLRLVPASNIHVVADGCDDNTAEIARSRQVNVLELQPGRGKAGGIEAATRFYDIPGRFAVLLIVDADTELDENYLARGLPMLRRPGVVALAGYAYAAWRPEELSVVGRFLVSYRARLYAVMQWLKYGQTWRWTNVTAIVPGFASMYRTSALSVMDLNPPGLVIEDFNMTFEIHHRKLGKIAFRPGVHATTQDPDNVSDYYRQVLRWHLGFWQTVRRHGFWRSWFSAALALFLVEVLLAAVGIVVLVGLLTGVAVVTLASQGLLTVGWIAGLFGYTDAFLTFAGLLLFLAIPDYLLTCATAAALRRPSLLFYGLAFLPIRFIDATAMLIAVPAAWRVRSSGQWRSPARRTVSSRAPQLTGASGSSGDAAGDQEAGAPP